MQKFCKKLIVAAMAMNAAVAANAGGILTNSNQSIQFVRMMARGASTEADAAYSNPAGLGFIADGWHFSIGNQSAYQTREIESTFALFPEGTRKYKGTASAPVVPSIDGVYKKDQWAISGHFGIVGGGGKASFDEGLPMFDSKVMALVYSQTQGTVTPDMYDINSAISGKQYIFGGQLGFTYRINEHFAAYGGFRMNYFVGNYSGYLSATLKANGAQLGGIELDCDQTGWGVNPILGVDYKTGKWTLAAKYEFKTNLNIENDTKKNSDSEGALADYKDGVNTPSDIPSLLTLAVGYEFTPRLRATAEWHWYDDKHAGMAHVDGGTIGKQHTLKHGTYEYLLGAEFDLTKRITLSCGGQITDYGLSDEFQSNTAFSCDSYSIGFGGAVKLTDNIRLNVGYFFTDYSHYKKEVAAGTVGYNGTTLAGTDNYTRTNKVFGVGVDVKF